MITDKYIDEKLAAEISCVTTRTVPFAFANRQVGAGSLTVIPIVPVGGFEVNEKQVSLQPTSEIANGAEAKKRNFKRLSRRQG
jgi:hypothetical protein